MNEDIVVSPVYDHVTQLDFTAPHQFLTMIPDIEVVVASIGAKPVISHEPSFDRLADLDKIDKCDVICVPGGLGCIDAIKNKRFSTRQVSDITGRCQAPPMRRRGLISPCT